MRDDRTSIRLLPKRSARMPAGMLAMTPVKAETEATKPTPEGSAPRWAAKRGSTGLFEIVELKIAKSPAAQSIRKGVTEAFTAGIPLTRHRVTLVRVPARRLRHHRSGRQFL